MKICCIILLLAGFLIIPASGGDWTLEGFLGTAWNLPTSLTIVQEGNPNIKFTAHYKEHAFEGFPYYTLRVGRWSDDRAWELELVDDEHQVTWATASNEAAISYALVLTDMYAVICSARNAQGQYHTVACELEVGFTYRWTGRPY